MYKKTYLFLISIFLFTAISGTSSTPYQIPKIDSIKIDGSDDDWKNEGFRVEFLTDPQGRCLPAENFDVKFHLGWTLDGLVVLAFVKDDIPLEHEALTRMWQKDCVEFFVADSVGSANRYQVVIAPGADPKYRSHRIKIYDHRPVNQKYLELTTEASSKMLENGYVLECLLPFKNLGLKAELGLKLAFQFVANDFDGDWRKSLRVSWCPNLEPMDPHNVFGIQLSNKPGDPILLQIDREIMLRQYSIIIRGSESLIGKDIKINSDGNTVVEKKLQLKEGRAGIRLDLPSIGDQANWPSIEVKIGNETAAIYQPISTLEQVIEKYIQASGGRENIQKLKSRKSTGRFINNLSWEDPEEGGIPFQAYSKMPDRWEMILHHRNGEQKQGFDGKTGWTMDADRIEKNPEIGYSKLGFLLNPHAPLFIQKYFPELLLVSKDTVNEREVYTAKSKILGDAHYLLYFDSKSGFLNKIGYYWDLQEYKEIDNVLLPTKIVMSRKGGSSTFLFEEIVHNSNINDSTFDIPNAGEVFSDVFEGIENVKVLPLLKGETFNHQNMNIPYRDARFIYDLILEKGYTRGLEIGTYNGYSALWMGLAFQNTGGKLITIEMDSSKAMEAQNYFQMSELNHIIELRITDAIQEIETLDDTFDFVFIDAWKKDYLDFLKLLEDRVIPGGAIVAHNVTNYAPDMKEFLDAIQDSPKFKTTFHQLSAEGLSVSIVQE